MYEYNDKYAEHPEDAEWKAGQMLEQEIEDDQAPYSINSTTDAIEDVTAAESLSDFVRWL